MRTRWRKTRRWAKAEEQEEKEVETEKTKKGMRRCEGREEEKEAILVKEDEYEDWDQKDNEVGRDKRRVGR